MRRKRNSLLILITIAVTFFAVVIYTYAATTISTYITTGGALTVTGATALNGGLTMDSSAFTVADASGNTAIAGTLNVTGAVWATSTLQVTGAVTTYGNVTLGDAATDLITVTGYISMPSSYALIGTTTQSGLSILTVEATSTAAIPLTIRGYNGQVANLLQVQNVASANLFYIKASGALFASSTLQVTGATTLYSTLDVTGLSTLGNATSSMLSVTGMTYLGNASSTGWLKAATINSDTGAISFSDENLTTTGAVNFATASSTGLASLDSLKISSVGSSVTGLVFGYCTIPNTTIAASTTVAAICASATGVGTTDRVFVQATSSLPTNFVILSASTTAAANQIGLYIHNIGYPTGVTATGINSINFYSIR